jgi:hypothetical protein
LLLAKRKFENFMAFFKIILKGRTRKESRWKKLLQKREKTGCKAVPKSNSQRRHPQGSVRV